MRPLRAGRARVERSALSGGMELPSSRGTTGPPAGAAKPTEMTSGLARDTLVLVHVKTRTKTEFGAPDRAVDAEKRQPLWQPRAITPRGVGVDWSRVRLTS